MQATSGGLLSRVLRSGSSDDRPWSGRGTAGAAQATAQAAAAPAKRKSVTKSNAVISRPLPLLLRWWHWPLRVGLRNTAV